jgi:hypothetical protein
MAAKEAGIRVMLEWEPREVLVTEDLASRAASHDRTRAMLPVGVMRALWDCAWGPGVEPEVELFADVTARVGLPLWCAQGNPPGSAGDGLDSPLWASRRRLWAFPPFALTFPVLRRIMSLRPNVVAILPADEPICSLGLPPMKRVVLQGCMVRLPPDFQSLGTPARPLAAFLPKWVTDDDLTRLISSLQPHLSRSDVGP